MKQALVLGALTAFALPILAEEKSPAANTAAKSDAKPVVTAPAAAAKPAAAPALAEVKAPAPAQAAAPAKPEIRAPMAPAMMRTVGSAELLSGPQGGIRMVYGVVPDIYSALGLTDEQSTAVQALCKEAQAEYKQATATDKMGRMTPEELQKRRAMILEKQAEISKKYEAKIAELLTAEQKTLRGKIMELAEKKTAEDMKIRETADAASKALLETYQKKLYAILPAEQAKKIESEDQVRKQGVAPMSGHSTPHNH